MGCCLPAWIPPPVQGSAVTAAENSRTEVIGTSAGGRPVVRTPFAGSFDPPPSETHRHRRRTGRRPARQRPGREKPDRQPARRRPLLARRRCRHRHLRRGQPRRSRALGRPPGKHPPHPPARQRPSRRRRSRPAPRRRWSRGHRRRRPRHDHPRPGPCWPLDRQSR